MNISSLKLLALICEPKSGLRDFVLAQGGRQRHLAVLNSKFKLSGFQGFVRAQGGGQCHLAGLVDDADVENASLQDRVAHAVARAADLSKVWL